MPENCPGAPGGGRKGGRPGHPVSPSRERGNDVTELTLNEFYSPSGPMSRLPGYEFRPQQLELALAVEAFLRDPQERTFAAEAPPGVGKTF